MLSTKLPSRFLASSLAITLMAAAPGADASDRTTAPGPAPSRPLEFLSWAPTPPMGWNSWDSFGTTITEAQAKEQADFMAEHLLPHGWRILTVDIQWYEPGASGHAYRPDAPLTMDAWGRLLPAPNRFPSAAGGAGFGPLAAYVHQKGLQLGIHLMPGSRGGPWRRTSPSRAPPCVRPTSRTGATSAPGTRTCTAWT